MKTKRAFLVKPGQFEIRELELHLNAGEVLVKVVSCGLCNWELNHWKGILGTFPQTLGHEWAGEVVEIGEGVKNLKIGDNVTALPAAMEGFSEYLVSPESCCLKVAPEINIKYALGEPLKCIITVLSAVSAQVGDYGIIQGCGPMGLWCIQALSGKSLAGLIALDVDDKKLALAKKYGATHVINVKKESSSEVIKMITEGHMADFLIDGTGIPSMLNRGQLLLRTSGRGRLVLMSSHEEITELFDFREAISRSLQILVPHPGYTTNQMDDLRRAISLINNRTFIVDELVKHEFKLDDIQTAFKALEKKPDGYFKGIVCP